LIKVCKKVCLENSSPQNILNVRMVSICYKIEKAQQTKAIRLKESFGLCINFKK